MTTNETSSGNVSADMAYSPAEAEELTAKKPKNIASSLEAYLWSHK